MAYFLTHWRGEQSLNRSFWLNGVAVRILVYGVFALLIWAQPLPVAVMFTVICVDLSILTWQVRGYFRAAEKNMRGHGSTLPFWGGTVALLVLVFVSLSQWWGLALATKTHQDEEQYWAKMERLHASNYEITLADEGRAISFDGDFAHGSTKHLSALLTENPQVERVVLKSLGGNVFEARGVAKLIGEMKLSTHVSAQCSSACTIAFIAGKHRTVSHDAKIGFHSYALLEAAKLPQFDIEAEQMRDRDFFGSHGVSPDFLRRIFHRSNQSIWFPSLDELMGAGVVHAISQAGDRK